MVLMKMACWAAALHFEKRHCLLMKCLHCVRSRRHMRQGDDLVTSYCGARRYLQEIYATDDSNAGADVDMMLSTQWENKSPR